MIKHPAPHASLQQPAVSIKPTDFTISHALDEQFPEVEQIRALQEAGRRIDVFVTRKWSDLQESAQGSIKKHGVLRVFIYNTTENQAWQQDRSGPASWTLRIEGRLLGEKEPLSLEKRRKFSDYLSGIAVDFDSSSQFSSMGDGQAPSIVEWHALLSKNQFDGMDIKRQGLEKVKCRITIQPRESPAKLRLDPRLAELLGSPELSERDVIYALWQYIQIGKLQDKTDKRVIHLNSELEQIFQVKQMLFPELVVRARALLSPVPPIVVDYEIATDKSSTLGDVVLDIDVLFDVPILGEKEAQEYAELEKNLYKYEPVIKALDTKIALDVQSLNVSKAKYDFFKGFSENPVKFLEKWQELHARALKMLIGDEGYTEEKARRSEFYTDEFLDENVDLLVGTNRL